MYMTFIDMEKAFDSVPRNKLWDAIKRVHLDNKWIGLIKRIYSNRKACIKIGRALKSQKELNEDAVYSFYCSILTKHWRNGTENVK